MPQTSRGGAVVAYQFRCLATGGSNPSPATRYQHNMKNTHYNTPIEQKAADAILQRALPITVNGITYKVPPVTLATLILVSREIARLPKKKTDAGNMVLESLSNAEDYAPLADILAVLILGARGVQEHKVEKRKRFFGLFTVEEDMTVDRKAELSGIIMSEWSFDQMYAAFIEIVKSMRLNDFFALTVSLAEANLLRQTRETATTASGRQSQESSGPTE